MPKKVKQPRLDADPLYHPEDLDGRLAHILSLRATLMMLKSDLAFDDGELAKDCLDCAKILDKALMDRGFPKRVIELITKNALEEEPS